MLRRLGAVLLLRSCPGAGLVASFASFVFFIDVALITGGGGLPSTTSRSANLLLRAELAIDPAD